MSHYSDTVLADGAVAYWRLGEALGVTAEDAGSNNLDGTYVGAPTLGVASAIGDSDTAVTLSGTSQYVTVADNNLLDFGDVMTFECWVRRTGSGVAQGLISKTGANGPRLIITNTNLVAMSRAGTAIAASTVALDTEWRHVVMTKNGATTTLYIDGVDVTQMIANLTISSTANVLLLGAATTTTQFFNGGLDEVAVYSTVLSSTQVQNHYNIGASRLAGTIAGVGTASSALTVSRPLEGAIAGAGTVTGDLTRTATLEGSIAGAGTVTGDIGMTYALEGSSAGLATVTGDLGMTWALEGTSTGVGTASASLTVSVPQWEQGTDSTWPVLAGASWSQTTGSTWPVTAGSVWPQDTDTNWS